MNEKTTEVIINGTVYIPKTEAEMAVDEVSGMEYCIIRTYSAGVHTGYLERHSGTEVILRQSRRIWQWAGAFTLSELAKYGTENPDECKFATTIDKITLTEAIEIIPCTERAKESIQEVKDYVC